MVVKKLNAFLKVCMVIGDLLKIFYRRHFYQIIHVFQYFVKQSENMLVLGRKVSSSRNGPEISSVKRAQKEVIKNLSDRLDKETEYLGRNSASKEKNRKDVFGLLQLSVYQPKFHSNRYFYNQLSRKTLVKETKLVVKMSQSIITDSIFCMVGLKGIKFERSHRKVFWSICFRQIPRCWLRRC